MPEEIVTVTVGGRRYTSFERISVSAALNEAARSFEFEVAHEGGPGVTSWTFSAGKEIRIAFNGSDVLVGHVDRYQPKIAPDRSSAIVSGRSKSADFVDGAALHDTGEVRGKTVGDLAKALNKFKIPIKVEANLKKIKLMRITPGETAFRAVERYCRSQGLTMAGTADGGIAITKGGQKRHSGGLIEGQNLLEAEADHNWTGRMSEYRVVGQRPDGHGQDNLEIERIVRDAAVSRFRPAVVVVEEDTDKERAQERAKNRKERAAGAALRASVTVQGFRDKGRTVFEPGHLIYVESPSLAIRQDMLLERVEFVQAGEEGSRATLSLVDPRAYGNAGGKGNKSGGAWSTGDE